jgi:alpha-mannosidase II
MRDLDKNELIMRINTSVSNKDRHFYTDLNGFQVVKRKRFSNFPIEANYYPSTTFLYLEDEQTRVTLVSSQSLGASSQGLGSLEVMLDRRLKYDDGRGLGEGVQDNRRTPSRFYLFIENTTNITSKQRKIHKQRHFSLPSLEAHLLADWLRHYPMIISLGSGESRNVYEPLKSSLPCDVILVNLRSLNAPRRALGSIETALILHRVGYDCQIGHQEESGLCKNNPPDGSIVLQDLFNETIKIPSAKESTLSLMLDKRKVDLRAKEQLQPMHLYTYRLLLG